MTKPFWKSNIDWIAAATIFLGFAVDPQVLNLLDPWWASKIMWAAGGLTFLIRTWISKGETLTLK